MRQGGKRTRLLRALLNPKLVPTIAKALRRVTRETFTKLLKGLVDDYEGLFGIASPLSFL